MTRRQKEDLIAGRVSISPDHASGAARFAAMLFEPATHVERDAGIEAVVGAAQYVHAVRHQPAESSRCTRRFDAGYLSSSAAGLIGRITRLPPQLGQMPE
jgi:hypothetical protein